MMLLEAGISMMTKDFEDVWSDGFFYKLYLNKKSFF